MLEQNLYNKKILA